jgi:choline dehydrogenase
MDQTIHEGRRVSSARAYLDPVKARPNLEIMTSVLVDRVLLRENRAVGVEVIRAAQRIRIACRREIILSAGAIGTPTILMRSGIGDPARLKAAGIPVNIELSAVGMNLHDHVDVSVKQETKRPITMSPELRNWNKARAFMRWLLFKTGPIATNHFEVAGYIRSSDAAKRPDVQICFVPLLVNPQGKALSGATHGYQATIMLLRPQSRGFVTIKSADPHVGPQILFNYLSEREDIIPLRGGIRCLREIFRQPSLADSRDRELMPGAEAEADADLDSYIRCASKSTNHACGTCRMGNGETAVVDQTGKVRKVSRLRIVDASIMPSITSGNIAAPVYMMAEKLSDAIRGMR